MDNSVGAIHQSDRPSAASSRVAGPERVPSKLRETCHACALSKVRCSKEKPSCSRCSKRGVTCEYIVTKRPGRKRDPKKSADGGHLHHHHHHHHHRCNSLDAAPELDGANENCMWMEDMLPGVAGVEGAGGTNGGGYLASAPPDPNSPMLWPVAAAEGAEMAGDMSDFLMPLITPMSTAFTVKTPDFLNAAADMVSVPGTPGHDQLAQDASASHVARLLLPDGAREEVASEVLSLDFLSTSMSASPSTAPQSSSLSSRALDDADPASNPCCCLVKALDMMARLSSTDLAVAPSASTTGDDRPAPQTAVGNLHHDGDSLLSATFTANRQTIEALGTMLHGSCQDNVYLLTCMSMIVSKVMRRYEVAAGQPAPAGADSGAEELYGAAASGCDDGSREARDATGPGGDPLRRLSAQLVLGELHMVQQLVNRLSSRLRSSLDRTKDDVLGSENGDTMPEDQAFSPSSSSMVSFDDKPDTPFFSAATLSQMDHDLRKGLAMLSSNIINMLRRI